jgi:hypothetical protein
LKLATLTAFIAVAVWMLGCSGDSPTDTSAYRELESELESARARIADLEAEISGAVDTPPSQPRGVSAVTGDGEVVVLWLDNPEEDLAGYDISRSRSPGAGFTVLASIGATTEYVDRTPDNGTTYYYAVTAVDEAGNVSELSREIAESTPRPQGERMTLGDSDVAPGIAGFRFSEGDEGAVEWDKDGDGWLDADVDIYFWLDIDLWVPYFMSDHEDFGIQDLGFYDDLQSLDAVPTEGYTTFWAEVVPGHVYAFRTQEGNYAKVHVTDLEPLAVTFDWAYQTQEDNPNVAPARDPAPGAVRRPRGNR